MEALDLDFEDMVASEDEGSEIISEDIDSDLLEEISEVIAEHISTLSEDASDEDIDELLESDELLEKVQKVISGKKRFGAAKAKAMAKAAAKYYKKNKAKLAKKAKKYRKKVASGARKVVKRILVKHNDPSDLADEELTECDDELSEEESYIDELLEADFTEEDIITFSELTEEDFDNPDDLPEAKKIKAISGKKRFGASKAKKMAKAAAKYYKKNKAKLAKKAAKYRKKVKSGAIKVRKMILKKHYDPSDDIDALVGDSELSEEFKTKASTIFEAAVNREIEKRSEQLEEAFEDTLIECTEEVISEVTDQVDSYLNHIAEEWLSLNELAVTNGIKSDLSENLLKGMKELFDLHYIEVPEQKVDVVEEFAAKIEDLEQRLNNQLNENISLKSQLDDKTKVEVVNEMTFDLVETEVEKLKELSEAVDFTGDVDDYKEKVSVIKESYFGGNPTSTHEDVEETSDTVQDLSESMSIYANVLSRSMK